MPYWFFPCIHVLVARISSILISIPLHRDYGAHWAASELQILQEIIGKADDPCLAFIEASPDEVDVFKLINWNSYQRNGSKKICLNFMFVCFVSNFHSLEGE
jgi:hypothetical protein